MDINQLLQKIPKPVLIFVILSASLAFFVYNDPLRDECEIQISLFNKKTEGLISSKRVSGGRTQFNQLSYWKDRCKEGNSIGSCEDYFEGLRTLTKELREVKDHCQLKLSEQNETFATTVSHALHIMALVAWGQKPPATPAERFGWLSTTNLSTFCYLKKTYILLAGEENYLTTRERVYREYPDEWPEKVEVDDRLDENRPRAYKTSANPGGHFTKDQIYEKSLFSIRCESYM